MINMDWERAREEKTHLRLLQVGFNPTFLHAQSHGHIHSTLCRCSEQIEKARVLRLLESSLELVLHDCDEFFVTESSIAVFVKDGENDSHQMV